MRWTNYSATWKPNTGSDATWLPVEIISIDRRVEAAFLYHAGLSYRRVEGVAGRSHEAVRQRYRRLAHPFEPAPDYHATVAVDETKPSVEHNGVYVRAAVDVDTFEVATSRCLPADPTSMRRCFSSKCKRCRGRPVIVVDRGPWHNWALDDLDPCEPRCETWGERSPVGAWFGLFEYRTGLFYSRFPHCGSWSSVDRPANAFAAVHGAITQP